MTQTFSGAALIVFALALAAYNIADTIGDLTTWHAATTPTVVMACVKQLASVVMGALGGTLLPPIGGKK